MNKLFLIVALCFIGCAGSSGSFGDPEEDAGVDSNDSGLDVDSEAGCNLSSCPVPPGNSQKCCANNSICGYVGGAICYPLKDSSTNGSD